MRVAGLIFAVGLMACGPSLKSANPYERHLAVQGASAAELRMALSDKDWRVAATACVAAQKAHTKGVVGLVSDLLAAKTFGDDRLEYLIATLAELGDATERRILPLYLHHRRPSVRAQVAKALAPSKLGGVGAETLLVRLLNDRDARVRQQVRATLALYDSQTARVPLAIAREEWVTAMRLGGLPELLAALRSVPAAKGREILQAVRGLGAVARPLLKAVLDQSKLSRLHLEAYLALSRSHAEAPLARYRQRTEKSWRARLNQTVARCESKNWYVPMKELRELAEKPAFDFLVPLLQDAKTRCRKAALRFVRRDLAKLPH